VGSKRMLKNANWAKYNLAVSVRKDTEYSSTTMWNANLPGDPLVVRHGRCFGLLIIFFLCGKG
jgi:primary-amine oxidase